MAKLSTVVREQGKNFLLMFAALTVVVLLSEVAVRIFWAAPGFKYPQTLHDKHEILGWVMKPNQKAYTFDVPVYINSHRLRDDEFTTSKPDNTKRILVLGDSVTFGVLVKGDETYPNSLEKLLEMQQDSVSYEVINAGVQRYYTYQELDYLKMHGLAFEPDIVILGYYINDLGVRPETWKRDYENSREQIATMLWQKVPYLMHIAKNSALIALIRDRVLRLNSVRKQKMHKSAQAKVLDGVIDANIEKRLAAAHEYIGELKSLSDEHNFQLLIAAFPNINQIIDDYPNSIYPGFIKEIADKYEISYVDLEPVFNEHYTGDVRSLYFRYDGHPNATGHKIAAETIFNALQAYGMIDINSLEKVN